MIGAIHLLSDVPLGWSKVTEGGNSSVFGDLDLEVALKSDFSDLDAVASWCVIAEADPQWASEPCEAVWHSSRPGTPAEPAGSPPGGAAVLGRGAAQSHACPGFSYETE